MWDEIEVYGGEGLADVTDADQQLAQDRAALATRQSVVDLGSLRVFLAALHRLWDRDPDAGHSINDELRDRVLVLISRGHPQAAELAQAVLVTDQWDVSSWTA